MICLSCIIVWNKPVLISEDWLTIIPYGMIMLCNRSQRLFIGGLSCLDGSKGMRCGHLARVSLFAPCCCMRRHSTAYCLISVGGLLAWQITGAFLLECAVWLPASFCNAGGGRLEWGWLSTAGRSQGLECHIALNIMARYGLQGSTLSHFVHVLGVSLLSRDIAGSSEGALQLRRAAKAAEQQFGWR